MFAFPSVCRADAGNDEPQAEGNVDGHPIDNKVNKNKIWSDTDEVWKLKNSDNNTFKVSSVNSVLLRLRLSNTLN